MNMPVYDFFSFYDVSVQHSMQLYCCMGSCVSFSPKTEIPRQQGSVLD